MIRRPPRSPLFPSPTLFRSGRLERAFTANGVEVTAKAFRFFAPGRRIENHADAHGRYLSRVEARESSVKPGAMQTGGVAAGGSPALELGILPRGKKLPPPPKPSKNCVPAGNLAVF